MPRGFYYFNSELKVGFREAALIADLPPGELKKYEKILKRVFAKVCKRHDFMIRVCRSGEICITCRGDDVTNLLSGSETMAAEFSYKAACAQYYGKPLVLFRPCECVDPETARNMQAYIAECGPENVRDETVSIEVEAWFSGIRERCGRMQKSLEIQKK